MPANTQPLPPLNDRRVYIGFLLSDPLERHTEILNGYIEKIKRSDPTWSQFEITPAPGNSGLPENSQAYTISWGTKQEGDIYVDSL